MLWGRNSWTRILSIVGRSLFWHVSFNSLLGEKLCNCTRLELLFRDAQHAIPAVLLVLLGQLHISNPISVAVNEVFGNRERLVLASASSVARSSAASSSSSDLETAMESWWTKHETIKENNGTATNVYLTNAPVRWEFTEITRASCSLLASSSQTKELGDVAKL